MKRFILRTSVFVALQAVLLGVWFHFRNLDQVDHYLAATIDKHHRLSQIASPKLILVGGSSTPFGIHSDLLESGLSRPVVNMGLVARTGIDFMLGEIESHIRPGDWIVLSFEYDLLRGAYQPPLLQELIALHPAHLRSIAPRQWRKVWLEDGFRIFANAIRIRARSQPDILPDASGFSGYQRSHFNRWGDYVAHEGQPGRLSPHSPGAMGGLPSDLAMSPEIRSRLSMFTRHCERVGARCFWVFPPRPETTWVSDHALLEKLAQSLSQIPRLEILDHPSTELYPLHQFFDFATHLTRDGSRERTRRILDLLSKQ